MVVVLKEVAVSRGDGPPRLSKALQGNKSSSDVQSDNKTRSRLTTRVVPSSKQVPRILNNTRSVDETHPKLGYANNGSKLLVTDKHTRIYITQNIKQPMDNAK